MTDTAEIKRGLRRELRARRRGLDAITQRRHGLLVTQHVARTRWFRAARTVALYLASDGEVDTMPLIRRCRALGKQVFLPRISPRRRMEFARYRRGDRLRRGCFGILEPSPGAPAIPARQLDLVLVPLVGYTDSGDRLGMGGGFYDRCFAGLQRPALVGLAHSCQRVEALPEDSWDVRLAGVITETGATGRPFGKHRMD
ncbi:MAG: 5-formyltetrahydrofolate cyclo-ligase [Halieaceae bacterium]|jgi:5-formyltetrahydrofolate cyclo-ligase|nr:5-formyltetrahydrofolate cyclo-ligase [Halieaceae bacterium]